MDKLDQLLALYTGRCVDAEAEYFLSVDVSGIEYNEEIKKRMLRYAFKRSRYERKRYAVKVILVACLVAMSVAFTACVSIPKIREAIWGAVIEWYDDHISVRFEEITEQTIETTRTPETSEDQSSAEITGETETSTNTAEVNVPPKTIEQKAYIANLPEGYYGEEGVSLRRSCTTNFYNCDAELCFSLTQTVLDAENNRFDIENERIVELKIKEQAAVLLENLEQPEIYTLIWTDGMYGYTLYGRFNSIYKMLEIASEVTLSN